MGQSSSSASSMPNPPRFMVGKVKDSASSPSDGSRRGEISQGNMIIFLIKNPSFLLYSSGAACWDRVRAAIPLWECPKCFWGCTHITELLFTPLMPIYLDRSTAIQGRKPQHQLCSGLHRRPPSSSGRLLLLLAEP